MKSKSSLHRVYSLPARIDVSYTARGHRLRFFDPIVLPLGRSIRVAASRKNKPVVRECFALTKSAVYARVKYIQMADADKSVG